MHVIFVLFFSKDIKQRHDEDLIEKRDEAEMDFSDTDESAPSAKRSKKDGGWSFS